MNEKDFVKNKEDFVYDIYKSAPESNRVFGILKCFQGKEAELQKDLANFTGEEILDAIEGFIDPKAKKKRLEEVDYAVKRYKTWACKTGKFFNVNTDGVNLNELAIRNIKKTSFKDAQELEDWCALTFRPMKFETSDNFYRCAVWFAFMGIKNEDLLNVKISDINLENMILNYDGEQIDIPEQAVEILETAMNQKHCYLTKFILPKEISREDGKLIWFEKPKKASSFRIYFTNRYGKEGGKDVSFNSIRDAGVFIRIHNEYDGKPIFAKIGREMYAKEHNMNAEDVPSQNAAAKSTNFKREYKVWNDAFYPEEN